MAPMLRATSGIYSTYWVTTVTVQVTYQEELTIEKSYFGLFAISFPDVFRVRERKSRRRKT
jgi:hypothetical protein